MTVHHSELAKAADAIEIVPVQFLWYHDRVHRGHSTKLLLVCGDSDDFLNFASGLTNSADLQPNCQNGRRHLLHRNEGPRHYPPYHL
jgi:hypothetical protein